MRAHAMIFRPVLLLVLILGASSVEAAQTEPVAQPATDKKTEAAKTVLRTVAVLGYEVKWLDDPEERKETAEALTTVVADRLSSMDEVVVVERTQLDKVLAEQKLNLTGLVDPKESVKIGRLLGAQFLLLGRGFKLGERLYITTKVINVETGQFKGIIIKAPVESSLAEVVGQVCDSLAEKLPRTIKDLSPEKAPEISPAEMLKRRLGETAKVWLIAAVEEHKGPPVIDPAIRNELEHLLSGAGHTVRSLGKKSAKSVVDGDKKMRSFDPDIKADYYVLAEGFSEFGKRFSEDLVTCVTRIEIRIVDAKTGNVLAAGSKDGRATDLSELLAAKQALRKTTRQLLLEVTEQLSRGRAPKAKEKDAEEKDSKE